LGVTGCGATIVFPTGVPQLSQNFTVGERLAPHFAHFGWKSSFAPQLPQNFSFGLTGLLHFGHVRFLSFVEIVFAIRNYDLRSEQGVSP
jgi:hypothetical protein